MKSCIEMTGGFRQFGYGSLIGDPSSENDKEYGGITKGWEKGAFCKDRHYRGTPDKLGVTMGALETEDGKGGLLVSYKKLARIRMRAVLLPTASLKTSKILHSERHLLIQYMNIKSLM